MAVATQKPQALARLVLEHHGIARFFVTIQGAADDESVAANSAPGKVEIVAAALAGLNPQTAVMVGDRHQDVAGA
ncbi:HAD family hydrolase, partial [Paraburkholderia sp. SIMBA_027]|uniref:HAD family hydrolase n=1 Tax=Paraburkholderia sp. SIMBA_027 TaxID=3085770 RepID=UPI00397A541A